ncbi:hypothetical protein ABPG74_011115 [Tetrahymena malaccensis]
MLQQVLSDEVIQILQLQPELRTTDHLCILKSFCHSLSYFENFDLESQEEQEACQMALKHMRVQQTKKNEHLFDIYAKPQKYFILVEGRVNVYQKLQLPPNLEDQESEENNFCSLKEDLIYNGLKLSLLQTKARGDSLGMIDLIYKRNYQSTAICQTDCVLFTLSQGDFQKYLKNYEHKNMMKMIQFLSSIPHFSNQSFGYLRDIAVNSNLLINLRGDTIYNGGQSADSVYFIKQGEYAILKKYDRNQALTSPIEKIIQDNIQQQGGPLFLGSPKGKKDLKLKIMTQFETFGEEDIIKGIQTRNHTVVCESRKGECLQISSNLFIQKVIDLQSTRITFAQLQNQKEISNVQQDQGNKVSIKNYKSFYFEEKKFQDLSPSRMQQIDLKQQLSVDFPVLQQSHRKSPVNESFEKSPITKEKKDMSFSLIMNEDVKKNFEKFPKISVMPSNTSMAQFYNKTTIQLQSNQMSSINDIQEEESKKQNYFLTPQISVQEINYKMKQNEDKQSQYDENELQFMETNGIKKHLLKKMQLKLHFRRYSNQNRSSSFSTENQIEEINIGKKKSKPNNHTKRIRLENDASFGVDNIQDLQKIITSSHVKNEIQTCQPKDLNNFGRLNLQKNYERQLKDKPKETKQVYTFELDERERQKLVIRKQKYKNYIHDWKKSPSPIQSSRTDYQEASQKKEFISSKQVKAIKEAAFLQDIEHNKLKIDELNQNGLLSSFYHIQSAQNTYRQKNQNSKINNIENLHLQSQSVNTSINHKDASESALNKSCLDIEQNTILQQLSYPRTKSPLAQLLIDQQNKENQNNEKPVPLMQEYVCTQIINPSKEKQLNLNLKNLNKIINKKPKEQEELFKEQHSYRGSAAKNKIHNLWKQKLQINTERRRNAQSQREYNLSPSKISQNKNETLNFMIQSQSSIQYIHDDQKEIKSKQNTLINQISVTPTPTQFKQTADQTINQLQNDKRLAQQNQSNQSDYRLTSILTTQSRGKRKKITNSVDTRSKQSYMSNIQSSINPSISNDQSKIHIVSYTSVFKKQNAASNENNKDNLLKSSVDGIDAQQIYQLKPLYKQ